MSEKQKSVLWLTVCAIFSKPLKMRASVLKFHYRIHKLILDLQSRREISLIFTIKTLLHTQKDLPANCSDFEKQFLSLFQQNFDLHGNQLNLTESVTVTIAKFTTSTRTDNMLQTNVKQLRAITMCSAFNPAFRYDNSNDKLTGNVFCSNTICLDILCVHKKTFQSLG